MLLSFISMLSTQCDFFVFCFFFHTVSNKKLGMRLGVTQVCIVAKASTAANVKPHPPKEAVTHSSLAVMPKLGVSFPSCALTYQETVCPLQSVGVEDKVLALPVGED